MQRIEDAQIRELFRGESAERLAALSSGLVRLEKEAENTQLIEELFREAHSLKGAARMLNLEGLEKIAHLFEDILGAVKKGKAKVTSATVYVLSMALAAIQKLIAQAVDGIAADLNLAQVVAILEQAKLEPQAVNQESPAPSASTKQASAASQSRSESGSMRVSTAQLDALVENASELIVAKNRINRAAGDLEDLYFELARQLENYLHTRQLLRPEEGSSQWENSQQLLLLRDKMQHQMFKAKEDSMRLESAVQTLAAKVSEMRLLPLASLFDSFPLTVRDISRSMGKQVEFKVEGAETKADKSIFEGLKDALMHLLRNALDHGIETPAERLALGKELKATLRLAAFIEEQHLIVEVEDDGRGLDFNKIREAAVQRGLLSAAAAEQLSSEEVENLIFASGFSTRQEVSALSGRGVGLDVVRTNVERLKGRIEVSSWPGQGALFRLHFPLNLSSARVFIVEAGGYKCCLPIEFIENSFFVEQPLAKFSEGENYFSWEGQKTALHSLTKLLGLPAHGKYSEAALGQRTTCLLLKHGGERMGLLCEQCLNEQEVVVKQLNGSFADWRHVSGWTILDDDEVACVLNVPDLFAAKSLGLDGQLQSVHPKPRLAPQSAKRVLLIEDSLIARHLTQRLLEELGCQVTAAADGEQGYARFCRGQFDLIVSDIEMPGLNGIELVKRVRQAANGQSLPFVFVTSLAAAADRERGLSAGADLYIVTDLPPIIFNIMNRNM